MRNIESISWNKNKSKLKSKKISESLRDTQYSIHDTGLLYAKRYNRKR